MEHTPSNKTIMEHRRPNADIMSASFSAAFETTPFKSLASSRQNIHRSYHTLPRKRNSVPCSHTTMQSESLRHSSMASIQTTTDDYTFTSDVNPNYTNMMNDNQLMDSCNQAQRDIHDRYGYGGGEPSVNASLLPHCGQRSANRSQSHASMMSLKDTVFNAQKLQQWIAYMRRYVEAVSPSRAEVLRMTSFERKTRLGEQVDLRKYIASYDATVKRFVRSATCAKGGVQVKHLEENYLTLLLQAIDAQCLLEGYPGMRNGRRGGGRGACRKGGHDEDDGSNDGSEPLVARFVEGQSSSPAIAYNYYCLNKSPVEDKCSEYSYDSVDGINLRDEILNVIGINSTAHSVDTAEMTSLTQKCGSIEVDEIRTVAVLRKETLEVRDQDQPQSNWTKKKCESLAAFSTDRPNCR